MRCLAFSDWNPLSVINAMHRRKLLPAPDYRHMGRDKEHTIELHCGAFMASAKGIFFSLIINVIMILQ